MYLFLVILTYLNQEKIKTMNEFIVKDRTFHFRIKVNAWKLKTGWYAACHAMQIAVSGKTKKQTKKAFKKELNERLMY